MSLAFSSPDEVSLQQSAQKELQRNQRSALQSSERKALCTDERQASRNGAHNDLEQAVGAVAEAERKGALWIPARSALANAIAAFAIEDYPKTIVQARLALRLVKLGMKQQDSPPYRHF